MTIKKGRILAIDYGLKRIGLALSDAMQVIASPLENLLASHTLEKTADVILHFLEELKRQGKEVVEIVIGLPLHMDGSESERSGQVRSLAELLKTKASIPVFLLDERLSSVQAERSLKETGFSRKKRAQVVDRVSAVIMLQTYLSQKSFEIERF